MKKKILGSYSIVKNTCEQNKKYIKKSLQEFVSWVLGFKLRNQSFGNRRLINYFRVISHVWPETTQWHSHRTNYEKQLKVWTVILTAKGIKLW
jgi:hypothetical protein